MKEFKVGDSVIILQGYNTDKHRWTEEMQTYVGHEVKVLCPISKHYYLLDNVLGHWHSDLLKSTSLSNLQTQS